MAIIIVRPLAVFPLRKRIIYFLRLTGQRFQLAGRLAVRRIAEIAQQLFQSGRVHKHSSFFHRKVSFDIDINPDGISL